MGQQIFAHYELSSYIDAYGREWDKRRNRKENKDERDLGSPPGGC